MALKKWVFGTKLSQQITEQNANLTQIDALITKTNAPVPTLRDSTAGSFLEVIKLNWSNIDFTSRGLTEYIIAIKGAEANALMRRWENGYGYALLFTHSHGLIYYQQKAGVWYESKLGK